MLSSSLTLIALILTVNPVGNPDDHIASKQGAEVIMTTSFYGGPKDDFHGRQMASGEIFDENNPTLAAHKSLKFGTKVKLTNPHNGESQIVIVKDRGPYPKNKKGKYVRDLDVSFAAAKKLGLIQPGVADLKAEIMP